MWISIRNWFSTLVRSRKVKMKGHFNAFWVQGLSISETWQPLFAITHIVAVAVCVALSSTWSLSVAGSAWRRAFKRGMRICLRTAAKTNRVRGWQGDVGSSYYLSSYVAGRRFRRRRRRRRRRQRQQRRRRRRRQRHTPLHKRGCKFSRRVLDRDVCCQFTQLVLSRAILVFLWFCFDFCMYISFVSDALIHIRLLF